LASRAVRVFHRPPALRARLLLILAAAACALGVGVSANVRDAAGRARTLHLVHFARFVFPTYVAGTPADPAAVYVLERTGRIWIVRYGHRIRHPFLDLHTDIRLAPNSEQGLLSLAFAPDYAQSGIYYVYYTNRQGDIRLIQFRRSRVDRNRTQPGSGRTILAVRHPDIAHYAGQLQFGPDGYLYVGVGDGGGVGDPPNHAQHLDNLFGKILRINPQRGGRRAYLIPRGNPFAHRHGARPEIFAYGLRNPYKFSFDPVTGAAWIGDVGQDRFEEVDYRARGRLAGVNFGWSRYEGYFHYSNRAASHPVFPILAEPHSGPSGTHENWCAVIGGYVVRDPTLHPLIGRYVFADHCTGRIFSTRVSAQGHAFATGWTGVSVPGLVTSFGTDAAQRVYAASENGWVYRLSVG
jgi:glucose/arabinose dehydrogenase